MYSLYARLTKIMNGPINHFNVSLYLFHIGYVPEARPASTLINILFTPISLVPSIAIALVTRDPIDACAVNTRIWIAVVYVCRTVASRITEVANAVVVS